MSAYEMKVSEIQQTLGRLNRDVSQLFDGAHPERVEALGKAFAEAKWLTTILEGFRLEEVAEEILPGNYYASRKVVNAAKRVMEAREAADSVRATCFDAGERDSAEDDLEIAVEELVAIEKAGKGAENSKEPNTE